MSTNLKEKFNTHPKLAIAGRTKEDMDYFIDIVKDSTEFNETIFGYLVRNFSCQNGYFLRCQSTQDFDSSQLKGLAFFLKQVSPKRERAILKAGHFTTK